MKATPLAIPDVMLLEPTVFSDGRGFFLETWNKQTFLHATGIDTDFVQDNHSHSHKGVLRGLHYQLRQPQGKLVRVTSGKVLDVAVDLRKSSIYFGQYVSIELNGDEHKQLWIPPGFAHGFLVLSDIADFLYKATDYYAAEQERCIRWDDPDLNIDWNVGGITPYLSSKDREGMLFKEADIYN